MSAFYQSLNVNTTNTDMQLYQVPSGKSASFSLNICNRTASKVKVRIALSANSTPNPEDYIEYDAEVLPGEALQRPGLVLPESCYVFARTDTIGVGAIIFGFVE